MSTKNFHIIQHVPFEGPGVILSWAEKQHYTVNYTRVWLGESFPAPEAFEWLVIMGGPMSVNEEAAYPWLAEEKKLIVEAVGAGKKVLGICLGAQAMAAALGAEIVPNAQKEIGWYPIHAVENEKELPISWLLDGLTAFHWHGETFGIPEGAELLCSSEATINQGFMYGPTALALQFHLEVNELSLAGMVKELSDELQPAAFVMSGEQIMKVREHLEANQQAMFRILDLLDAAN